MTREEKIAIISEALRFNSENMESVVKKSDAQLDYVLSPIDKCVYLEACAGSGKTEVLGIKAAYEIQKWESCYSGILNNYCYNTLSSSEPAQTHCRAEPETRTLDASKRLNEPAGRTRRATSSAGSAGMSSTTASVRGQQADRRFRSVDWRQYHAAQFPYLPRSDVQSHGGGHKAPLQSSACAC